MSNTDSPLHIAVKNNNVDLVKMFLERQYDVHAVNAEGLTPLQLAVQQGNTEMVALLLQHGAGDHPTPTQPSTPRLQAAFPASPPLPRGVIMSNSDSLPAEVQTQNSPVDVMSHANHRKRRITFWTVLYTISYVLLFGVVFFVNATMFALYQDKTLSSQEIEERVGVVGLMYITVGLPPISLAYLCCFYMYLYRLWEEVPAKFARTTPGYAAGFSLTPFFCCFWWFAAFVGLYYDMNKTMNSYGLGTRFGTVWVKIACVCWFVLYIFCIIMLATMDPASIWLGYAICIFLQTIITIPMLWVVRNSVLEFIDIKARTQVDNKEMITLAFQHGEGTPSEPTQPTTRSFVKNVAKIIIWFVALVALAIILCILLVGLDVSGIIRLPEIPVVPEGFPLWLVGGALGMLLLFTTKTGKALLNRTKRDSAFAENSHNPLATTQRIIFWVIGLIVTILSIGLCYFFVLMLGFWGGERHLSIEHIREAAERGVADAQRDLGLSYYYGWDVARDDAEAVKWLLLAAEQGQVDALYQLGLCYFLGAGVPRNEDEAIRSYWMAMQGGHAGAAFVLHKLELEYSEEYRQMKIRTNYGSTYERNGKPFDIALPTAGGNLDSSPNQLPRVSRNGIFDAFDIMHRDEQLTHLSYPTVRPLDPNKTSYYHLKRDTIYVSPNCTQIAFDHELGRKLHFDIEKEWVETAKQRRIAAERGDAEAQWLLALCYLYGNGVPHDYSEAAKWFRKSAEQGNAAGQYELGVCYRNGGGVPQDDAEAVKWITKAAEQGLDRAQSNLGLYYLNGIGVPQDKQKAIQWLRKAVDQENAQAQCILGECFYNGDGVPQNKEEAINLYRKSAEQGYAGAQFNLGECYFLGEGVAQDKEEAVMWLHQAAEQGHEKAANLLREIEQR